MLDKYLLPDSFSAAASSIPSCLLLVLLEALLPPVGVTLLVPPEVEAEDQRLLPLRPPLFLMAVLVR